MADHLTRAELKKDELTQALEAGAGFVETHLKAILYGLGGVAVVGVTAWALLGWQESRALRANERLGAALRIASAPIDSANAKPDDPSQPSFATEAARDAKARPLFEAVVSDFGSTSAGASARLWLAERALAGGDSATARKLWQEVLEDQETGSLAAVAKVNLMRLDRAEGKAEAVLTEIQTELNRTESPLPPDLLLFELGQTYDRLGRPADARAAYQRLVDEHGGSPYAAQAQQALARGTDAS